jgi:hypothetical protein
MTFMPVMTMNRRGSLKGVRHSAVKSRDRAMGRQHGEYKSDKGRCRYEVRTLYSSPNISSATPIDRACHPVWVMSSRYFERASIIRWRGIRAGAPPMLLLACNPRAAERDTPSTKPARDYPTPKRSIIPISPQMVATNRLDKAQRPIGPLPIMGPTLPITVKEPD